MSARRENAVGAKIERIEAGGLALTPVHPSRGLGRAWLPWPVLGLAEAPKLQGDSATLRWRVHCVRPESNFQTFQTGEANHWRLKARRHASGITGDVRELRTGVLEVDLQIEQGAVLEAAYAWSCGPSQLRIAPSFSMCLQHRQEKDKGAECLCGRDVASTVRSVRNSARQASRETPAEYASRWGAIVEQEAAASAVQSNESRLLADVAVTWKTFADSSGRKQRHGHFEVHASLARAHRLKFRGLIPGGGEQGSSWLCLREIPDHYDSGGAPWSGHARITRAGFLDEGQPLFGDGPDGSTSAQLMVDDEDVALNNSGRRSIHVTFVILDETSDRHLPSSRRMMIEYIPKSMSYSMMHLALGEVNQEKKKDDQETLPLLARDIVLGKLKLSAAEDKADLSAWRMNPSQEMAIRKALARQLLLVHGPPGTGKTKTAAVLMTVFAQRNLGTRCATLFAAPTNRAADCALFYTNKLCEEHFAERLRARVQEDGDAECAICFDEAPDIVTACGHVFHRSCIALSLQESGQCPLCRQVLKQAQGGLRMLRVYGADAEKQDFPVPKRADHQGIQTSKIQEVHPSMRRFTLHWRCHAAVEGEEPSAEAVKCREAYELLRSTAVRASNFDERRTSYYIALSKARAVEVRQADVIFTTCISARRTALQSALLEEGAPKIRQVVLDEAGQAPEPEALCPLALAKKAEHAVLFGDHQQLQPILKSRAAEHAGLRVSLFERLAVQAERARPEEAPIQLLAQQYRMHPNISKFPRSQFYGGRVNDDPSVLERPVGLLGLPQRAEDDASRFKAAALMFWDCVASGDAAEQLQLVRTVGAGGVGSRANQTEATRAKDLAVAIAEVAGDASVAVLSWYNNQVAKVKELLQRSAHRDIHVGSIATAQGSEWDYVILSTVRSGGGGTLGLLADPHNLNVALTRARYGLVVLGDSAALKRDSNWAALLADCRAQGVIIDRSPKVRQDRRVAPPAPQPPMPSRERVVNTPPPFVRPRCAANSGGNPSAAAVPRLILPPPPPPMPPQFSNNSAFGTMSGVTGVEQFPFPPTPPMPARQHQGPEFGMVSSRVVPPAESPFWGLSSSSSAVGSFPVFPAPQDFMLESFRSALGRCPCGNFANPALEGKCNACARMEAEMPATRRQKRSSSPSGSSKRSTTYSSVSVQRPRHKRRSRSPSRSRSRRRHRSRDRSSPGGRGSSSSSS